MGEIAYRRLYHTGELRARVEQATAILENCRLCPRRCGVNRLVGELGKCHTGKLAVVSSYGPHFGEEAPLIGRGGSGTIFFAHCNLRCIFCQNYPISQWGEGRPTNAEALAAMMLYLQSIGCHNINLVTSTHVVPQILAALELAVGQGLSIPLVYNCGGYESLETLRLLHNVVDIYMPDMKYSDESIARRLSGVKDYPQVNQAAVKEMHRQVGDLQLNERGVATRGLLVRHLVLPQDLAGTATTLRFLAEEISPHTYLNIMSQYRPAHRAFAIPPLDRPISHQEFMAAVRMAQKQGLTRLDGVESRPLARLRLFYLMSSSNLASLSATVYGKVQGVFFRAFVYHHARALGLRGFVSNLPEGRAVEVFAEGERKNLEELLRLLHCGPSGAWVEKVEAQWEECGDRFASFEIKH